jgi:N-acetylglucosamine kinase-like BadF-type ATPase
MNAMGRYFLGVDGGQSSTTALVGDETGRVLGYGRGGPCNHIGAAEGRTKFVNAINGCVGQALEQAGLPRETAFEAGCLGFSGGGADKEAIVAEILTIEKRLVTHDAMIALSGAMAGGAGVITIAGTGSIAFGRNDEGRTGRAGGWGYAFGDEGGGFDLTRQALRAALRMEEGWGPPTPLRALLLEATGAKSANDLLHRFYTTEYPRSRVASLSRLVDQASQQGDSVATDILHFAGSQLAGFSTACRRQLFDAKAVCRFAYIGGVFQSARLLERYRQALAYDEFNQVAPPLHGPAAGALFEAYRLAGLAVILANLPAAEK